MASTPLETSDDLLVAFKRDSYIAASQGNFDDTQLLAVADMMTTKHVVPFLKSLDSGWYIGSVDVPLTATNTYALPQYAMYGMLYRVARIRVSDGIERDELNPYVDSDSPIYANTTTGGTPQAYVVRHNQLILNRVPGASDIATDALRLYFFRRPGRLVKVAESAKVLSINTGTGVVTYTVAPPATFTATSTQDFYLGLSPFVRKNFGVVATALAGSTQTFPVASVTLLTAGDYVTLINETIYPDMPQELYPFLLDLMDLHLARAKLDAAVVQDRTTKIMEDMRNAMIAPGDRIKGQKRKLSLLNSGLIGARRRRMMISD